MDSAVTRLERVAERLERLAVASGSPTGTAPALPTPSTQPSASLPSSTSAPAAAWPGFLATHMQPLASISGSLSGEIQAAFQHYQQAFQVSAGWAPCIREPHARTMRKPQGEAPAFRPAFPIRTPH